MLIVAVWVSVTGVKNNEDIEDVEFKIVNCTPEQYAALTEAIRIRMEMIKNAQSSESCTEEDRQFPLVRVDPGI